MCQCENCNNCCEHEEIEENYSIFGENLSVLQTNEDLDEKLKEEMEALSIIRNIQSWRAKNANSHSVMVYGVYKSESAEQELYFDADRVWVNVPSPEQEDSEMTMVDEIDLVNDGDLILAVYRYLRNDFELCYPWYTHLLEDDLED